MRNILVAMIFAFALAGCGAPEGIDVKAFAAVSKTDFGKESIPVACVESIEYEDIAFTQKCWRWGPKGLINISEMGERFAEFGYALSAFDEGNVDIIERNENHFLVRYQGDADCPHYMIITIYDINSAQAEIDNLIDYGLAVSQQPHCGAPPKV